MANETVVQASQQTGNILPFDPVIVIGVTALTGIIGISIYLLLNDNEYSFFSRLVTWTGSKIRAEESHREINEEELEKDIEKVAKKHEDVDNPEELYATVEAIAENKEYIGRQEERKKQRKDENLKDIMTVILITSGLNLLLRLFEMFA